MEQKRCTYCGGWIKAAGERRKTCGRVACRRANKRAWDRQWRANNPAWVKTCRGKVRQWAKQRDYWKKNRLANTAGTARNREQTRDRLRRKRAEAARHRMVLENPVAYLQGLKTRCGGDVCKTGLGTGGLSTEKVATDEDVCKTGPREPVLNGVVNYLLVRAMFAKQDILAVARTG